MLIPFAIGFIAVVAIAALIVAIIERRHRRRRPESRRDSNGFIPWDWPTCPVNGHDHPEPPELEQEPAA